MMNIFRNYNNLKTRVRFLYTFAFILFYVIFSFVFLAMQREKLSTETNILYNEHLVSIDALVEADIDMYEAGMAMVQAIFHKNKNNESALELSLLSVNENLNQAEKKIEIYLSTLNKSTVENTLLSELENNINTVKSELLSFEEAITNAKNLSNLEDNFHSEFHLKFESMRNFFNQLIKIGKLNAEKAFQRSIQIKKKSHYASSILFIIILGLVSLASFMLTRSIRIPIEDSTAALSQIAEGNLSVTLNEAFLKREDEIGTMSVAIEKMTAKLKDIVENIQLGAESISAASDQLNTTSQNLSQNAYEQAANVEEISSSMEEMVANVLQNAENAEEADKITIQTNQTVKEGNEATSVAANSMRTIAEKVQVINDIAYQTNILALNASVEAARAGEHGRGFSVVANEVRALAESSRSAAEEINKLTVEGVNVSHLAGKKLNELVPEIQKTTELVQGIAVASQEQNNGADQINNAIQQLNQATQQNAASSDEMASSAEELSAQAEHLKDLINFFKVK